MREIGTLMKLSGPKAEETLREINNARIVFREGIKKIRQLFFAARIAFFQTSHVAGALSAGTI